MTTHTDPAETLTEAAYFSRVCGDLRAEGLCAKPALYAELEQLRRQRDGLQCDVERLEAQLERIREQL